MRTATYAGLLLAISMHLDAQSHSGAPAKPITLRDVELPDQMRRDILTTLMSEMNIGELDPAQTQQIAFDSTVTSPQFSLHGPAAILVNADPHNFLCGAGPYSVNCPSWLFQKTQNHAVLIFETVGMGLDFQPTSHHGLRDILTADREGLTDVFIEVDEFDGKTYKPAYCYESGVNKNGRTTKTAHHKC